MAKGLNGMYLEIVRLCHTGNRALASDKYKSYRALGGKRLWTGVKMACERTIEKSIKIYKKEKLK